MRWPSTTGCGFAENGGGVGHVGMVPRLPSPAPTPLDIRRGSGVHFQRLGTVPQPAERTPVSFLGIACLSSHRPTGRFLCRLRISTDPRLPRRDRTWRLTAGLGYTDSSGRRHRIPGDFETDGCSIPRFFWRLIGHPMDEKYIAAAVIHDALWRQALAGEQTFSYANWVFRDALRSSGVWWWRRTAMWLAVTLNGWWRAFRRPGCSGGDGE